MSPGLTQNRSFDFAEFKSNLKLEVSFVSLCHNMDPFFERTWNEIFLDALRESSYLKRQKRSGIPFYSTSITIHKMNKLETARRKKNNSTKFTQQPTSKILLIWMNLHCYGNQNPIALKKHLLCLKRSMAPKFTLQSCPTRVKKRNRYFFSVFN